MLPQTDYDNKEVESQNRQTKTSTEFVWPTKPRYRLTGLQNQGGTCYLNTLVQTLLHTPEFTYRLFNLARTTRKECLKRMIQEMLNLFEALISNNGGAISSKPLTDSFGWTEDEVCVHQDIQELNRLLFEQIEIALKGTHESNLIRDLFRGTQCTRICCLRCRRISERNDEFYDINLSVMEHDSVEASLIAHTQMERLSGENQYYCESCKSKVDAIKMTRFEGLPPILTISLSRFYFDPKTMQSLKLEKKCSFPFVLDMNAFLMDKIHKRTEYDLFSVVLHVGGSTGGGHYHAFIKDPYGTIVENTKESPSASEFNANNKCHSPIHQLVKQHIDVPLSSDVIDLHLPTDHGTEDPPVAYGEQPQIYLPRDCNLVKFTRSPQKAGEGDHKLPSATPDDLSASAREGVIYANRSLNTTQSYQEALYPLPLQRGWGFRISQDDEKNWLPDQRNDALRALGETAPIATRTPLSEQMYLPQFTCDRDIADRMRQSLVVGSNTGRQKMVRSKQLSSVQTLRGTPPFPQHNPKLRKPKARPTETEQLSIKRLPFDSRITGAISVQQVKPSATAKTVQGRTHSAHTAVRSRPTGSAIVESEALHLQNRLLTPSSHAFRKCISGRTHKSPTHVGRVGCTIKSNNAGTALLMRRDGHNNSSRQRVSSASSSSPTPRTPTAPSAMATGPIHVMRANPKQAACSTWRSRLFEETGGLDTVAKTRNHAMNYVTDSRSVRSVRSVNMTGYPKCPDKPPPVNSSLSTIPPVSRSNARCPSRSTNSFECGVSYPQPAVYSSTLSSSSTHSPSGERSSSEHTVPKKNTEEEEVTADSSTIRQNSVDNRHDYMKRSAEAHQSMPEVLVGRWFDINDDCIAEVDPATFSRVFEGPECAYMLFYRLMSLPLPVSLLKP